MNNEELHYVKHMEFAEKAFAKFLFRMTKDVRFLERHTLGEEKAIRTRDHHAEVLEDRYIEQDIYTLLSHFIHGFRALIAVEKDLERMEYVEGRDAQHQHDIYKGKIEKELSYLIKELKTLRGIEDKI